MQSLVLPLLSSPVSLQPNGSDVSPDCLKGPVEVAKNATQTSVLMAGLSGEPRDPSVSRVAPKKNIGRISSIAATREILQRHGFLGLYTGFKLHLARDVVGSAIYFGVYEATKQAMTSFSKTEKANTPLAVATAGMLCGICSWSLVSQQSCLLSCKIY